MLRIGKRASGIIGLIVMLGLAGCAGPFDGETADDARATLSLNVRGLELAGSQEIAGSGQAGGSEIGASAMDPSGIVSAEVTVDALNFDSPVTDTVSLANGAGTSTLTDLATGPNRVIKVVGKDAAGNVVAGAEMYSTANLYPGNNSITVNWETTARGRVFWDLLMHDKSNNTDYSVTLRAAELQTKIEGIVSDKGLGHPNVVDASRLAADVISNGGTLPSSTWYVRPTGMVSVDITGMGSRLGWPVEILVTDPTSQPVSVSGDGRYTIDEVLPGDWTLVLIINGGAYKSEWTLEQVSPNGTTWTATDATGNSIDLRNWDLSGILDISIDVGTAAFANPNDTMTTDVSATVNQITVDSSGNVGGYVSFIDQDGDPISNLNEYNFTVEESLDQVSWTTLSSDLLTVESVGNAGRSVSTALTMDYSGSMSSTDISNMETATSSFIANMGATDQAVILKFGGDVTSYPSSGFSSDTSVLGGYVTETFTGYTSSTALYDAVGQGLELLNSSLTSGLNAAIAFTDGSDNASSTWNEQGVIDYSNNNDIPIYSIGFGSADTVSLENIATSGVYEYAPDSSTLLDIYDQIAKRLRETYVVDWETIGTSGDTVYVRISVTYTSANGSHTELVTANYTL